MTCESIMYEKNMLLVERRIDTGRIPIFIVYLVKILTYFHELRHYLMNEYTNRSTRHLRRTHHYPKAACTHRTWLDEAPIILHAMRAAESTISLAAKTGRVGWEDPID